MTDIKDRLMFMGKYGFTTYSMKECNEAADHIATQEKRIAELEALNASLVAHDPIQVCTDAWELTHEFCEDNCVSLYETENCFAHAAVEYVLSRLAVSPPAPADAIDAMKAAK